MTGSSGLWAQDPTHYTNFIEVTATTNSEDPAVSDYDFQDVYQQISASEPYVEARETKAETTGGKVRAWATDDCTQYEIVLYVEPNETEGATVRLRDISISYYNNVTEKWEDKGLPSRISYNYNLCDPYDPADDPASPLYHKYGEARTIKVYSEAQPSDTKVYVDFIRPVLKLDSNLGDKATVTFYTSTTEPTEAFISSPGTAATIAKPGEYVVMNIVPGADYWTNADLLFAKESTVSLMTLVGARLRGPGLDIGSTVNKLGSGQKANGEGWYYYQIPAEHSVENGYKFSGIDGFVVPKFDLSNPSSVSGITYNYATGDWTTSVTIDKTSFTYNGTAQGPQISNTNIVVKKGNDEAVTLTVADHVKISGTATDASTTDYTATLSKVDEYSIFTNSKDIDYTIGQKEVGLTWTNNTPYTYNGSAQAPTVSLTGLATVSGVTDDCDATVTLAATTGSLTDSKAVNVGNYTATVTGLTGAKATNYKLPTTGLSQTFAINSVSLTITALPQSLVYNGSAQGEDNKTYTNATDIAAKVSVAGLKGSDALTSITLNGTKKDKGVYANTIEPSAAIVGTATNNYEITYVSGTLTISAKTLTPEGDGGTLKVDISPDSKVYNGEVQTPTITLKDGETTISPDDYTVTYKKGTEVAETKNVGDYTVVIESKSTSNYTFNTTGTFSITKATTEITINEGDPEWGGVLKLDVNDTFGPVATLNPAEAGNITYTLSTTDVPVVTIGEDGMLTALAEGTVTITASFAGSDNYAAAKSKSITAKVSLINSSVSVDNEVVNLLVGETHTVIPTTTPDGLNVTYVPDDSGVASIDADGKITALKEGTAIITAKVGGDGVYAESTATVTVHVTQILTDDNIVLDIPTGGYIYDATPKTPAVTVKYGDKTLTKDVDYTVSYSNNVNAGDNTASVTVTDIAGGDYDVSGTKTFSIAQAPLTVKAANQSLVYNGSAQGEDNKTYTSATDIAAKVSAEGLKGSDALTSITLNGTKKDKGVYANTIEPSAAIVGTATNNYEITYVSGTLTISAKTLKPESEGGTLKVDISPTTTDYNGAVQTPTVTLKDGDTTISPDDYTVTYKKGTEVAETKNVGDYTVVIESKSTANYTFNTTRTFSITKATLTVTAANQSFVYDGSAKGEDNKTYTNATDIAAKVSVTGLQGTDALTSITLNGTKEHKGVYANTIEPSAAIVGTATDNYNIKYVSGTLTIGEKALTVTITGKTDTKTYSGAVQSVTGYTIAIPDGATLTEAEIVGPTKSAIGKDVKSTDDGKYMMGLVAGDFSTTTADYAVTFTVTDGWLKITPAALTINANAVEKAAGDDDPELSYTTVGLKDGDAISGKLERAAGETVGTYAISQGDLSAGDNYTVTFKGADFVIYRAIDGLFADGCEWATFVANEDLAIPEGLQAYVVTAIEGTTVVIAKTDYIAKGVGFLLKRSDKSVNSFKGYAFTGTPTSVPESLLTGSATAATDIQMYKDFVLYNDNFELAGVSSVEQWHAYLPASALNGAAGSRRLTISGDDTGIGNIVLDDTDGDGVWYSIDGRRLQAKPTKKGLYIHKGKTTVIK
jgi:hypothetical protein